MADPSRCWAKGILVGEALCELNNLLSRRRQPVSSRHGVFVKDSQLDKAITSTLEDIGSKLRSSDCLTDKAKVRLLSRFKDLHDSAKQGDLSGFEERIYDLQEELGFAALGMK